MDDFGDNENNTDYLTEPVFGDPIVSYVDIVLETNSPPIPQELEVYPVEGEAMQTIFNFKTSKAQDKVIDGPILYNFGYMIKDTFAIFSSLSDVINTNTVLPYSSGKFQKLYLILIQNDKFFRGRCEHIFGSL